MCKSHITLKKFLKLVLEIEFYKTVIYLIFVATGVQSFSLLSFAKALLPVNSVGYDFSSCYLLFYLFIPFLNALINRISERQHILIILLLLFTYTFIGTAPNLTVIMNYVSWFIVMYFVSSYFRMYPHKIWQKTTLWGVATAVSLAASIASMIGIGYFGVRFGKNDFYYSWWLVADSNKILALVLSVSAFLFFKNVKIKQNSFINTVATSIFGVLLIHDNCDAMRQWLWKDTLNNAGMYHSQYMVLHAVGSVLAVFIVCIVIDYFRILLLEKPFFRFYDRHYEKISQKINSAFGRICNKLNIG